MIEVGMDQHKHFTLAASMNPRTGQVMETRLEHNAPDEIRDFIKSLGPEVRVSLEATGNWYWLFDLLEEEGAEVQLANTVETRRLLKLRPKTDRHDAMALARLSAEGRLPQVYVPVREVRDDRERHRHRIRLVRMQSGLKNTIHSVLSKLNIEHGFSDLFGKKGLEFLDALELRQPYDLELRSALAILRIVMKEVKIIEAEIKEHLREDPQATVLQTIPGVGLLTAYLLLHEIGPIQRFTDVKKFSSYACLCPGTWQSANKRRDMPVGRHGNLYLKGALTESAQTAVRVDPTLKAYYRRLTARKGKGKALVAVAHKLAIAVYYVLYRNKPYRPAKSVIRKAGKPILCPGLS